MRRVMAMGAAALVGAALWVAPASARTSSSGNGEASKSAAAIFADAKAATGAATSLRISGSVVQGGKKTRLDLVSSNGAGGGTIGQNGAQLQIIVQPPDVYLKADARSWTTLSGTPAAGQLLAGKWLQTTTGDSNFGSFSKLLDPSALAASLTSTGAVTKGSTTTFRGQSAIPLNDQGKNGTLYVAATGKPYILGLRGIGAKAGSQLLFTQYNSAKVRPAPSGAISLSELEQQSTSTS